jgi:tetratricopeptide (TPR) repeat protein
MNCRRGLNLTLWAWSAFAQPASVDRDLLLRSVDPLKGEWRGAVVPVNRCAGDFHKDVTCLIAEGMAARYAGRPADALPLLERALEMCAAGAPPYQQVLLQLAGVYQALGRLPDAERTALEAVKATNATGASRAEAVEALALLGGILVDMGRFDAAEPLLRAATERIKPECFASAYCAVLVQNAVAAFHIARGRFEHAGILWRESLELVRSRLGEDSPSYAPILFQLSTLYALQGKPERALPLLRRAAYLYEKLYGPSSPMLVAVWEQEGALALGVKDGKRAERLFAQALAVARRPEVRDVLRLKLGKARALAVQGKREEAERAFLEVIESERGREAGSELMATSLVGLADLYATTKREAMASPLYEQAIAIFEGRRASSSIFRQALLRYAAIVRRRDKFRARQLETRAYSLSDR